MLLKRLRPAFWWWAMIFWKFNCCWSLYIRLRFDSPSDSKLFNYAWVHRMFGINKTYSMNRPFFYFTVTGRCRKIQLFIILPVGSRTSYSLHSYFTNFPMPQLQHLLNSSLCIQSVWAVVTNEASLSRCSVNTNANSSLFSADLWKTLRRANWSPWSCLSPSQLEWTNK